MDTPDIIHRGIPLGADLYADAAPPVVHEPGTRCAAPGCTTRLRRTNPWPVCSRPTCQDWHRTRLPADDATWSPERW